MSLKKIISGGQTGADIAAIDAAIVNGMPYGGWLPKGRKTENGPLDLRYTNMTEMSVGDYQEMTEQNVKEADGTVIFTHGKYTGVSALTSNYAAKHNKPVLHLDLDVASELAAIESLIEWIYKHNIATLNVAGSRESKDENIYDDVHSIIKSIINTLKTAEIVDAPQTPLAPGTSGKEPIVEPQEIITKEVVARDDAGQKGSAPSSVFSLAALIEGWSKIRQKNLVYVALGILATITALMIIPGGFKNSSSENTTAKSIPLHDSQKSKTAGVPNDSPSTASKTQGPQTSPALQTTTNSTQQAGIQPLPANANPPVASQTKSPENNPDIKTDAEPGVVDQLEKKENEPLQSLSDTAETTDKTATSRVHLTQRHSKKRSRCGYLYKKMALGEVLKKTEAKFLADNCK